MALVDLGLLRLPSAGPFGAEGLTENDLDLLIPDWLPDLPKQGLQELGRMSFTGAGAEEKRLPASSPKGPLHMHLSSASVSDAESEGRGGQEDDDPSFGSKSGSLTSQDSEAAARVRRSARLHRPGSAEQPPKIKEKRKVGCPIAWVGDPNSPDLTPQERRRIKRRIANRESARRVHARRQDMLEEMIEKARDMEAANVEMQRHTLEAQAADFRARWRATATDNARLQAELAHLREALASQQPPPDDVEAQAEAPAPATARAQSWALLDTLLPVEPMAVLLGDFLVSQAS